MAGLKPFKKYKLERYIGAFQSNDIDIEIARELDENDLKEIGISSFGHRRKL